MKYILLRVTGGKKWRDKLEELEEIERELEEIERELNERKTRLQGIFMSENSSCISSAAWNFYHLSNYLDKFYIANFPYTGR